MERFLYKCPTAEIIKFMEIHNKKLQYTEIDIGNIENLIRIQIVVIY